MSQFKTQAEIWRALLEGKKIKHKDWIQNHLFLYCIDGFQVLSDDKPGSYSFKDPEEWSIYHEPKPKKILKPFLCRRKEAETQHHYLIFAPDSENELQLIEQLTDTLIIGPAKGIPDQEIAE